MVLKVSMQIPGLSIKEAFERFSVEIKETLLRKDVNLDFTKKGMFRGGSEEVAHITTMDPPHKISLDWWHPDTRGKEFITKVHISFSETENPRGTRVSIEHDGWDGVLEKTGSEPIDWFTNVIGGHFLWSTTPMRYGEWLINRGARKPSGTRSKMFYSDPVYHKPNFLAILEHLKLSKEDYLLEIGCGGGYFLHEALKSGCRAAAIDHSPEMIEVASHKNASSIKEGKLNIFEGEAEALPFEEGQFTCAVSTGVFGFIRYPSVFFSEVFRVLRNSGRFVLYSGSKKLKGTPAAPDPIADDYIRWYEDEEIVNLASEAGFQDPVVLHPDLKDFAVKSGVPKDALNLFADPEFGQLLIAIKK